MRQLKITKSITNRQAASLDKYLNDIGKEGLITADEEVLLAQRIKQGDQSALEKLCKANLRFVVSVAKQYQNQGLSLPDLINEGNLGLIKAGQRFDETRGFKFISYAVWWIRQSILQALAEQSRIVRLPLNQVGSLNKIKKVSSRLEQEFERLPSIKEIAVELEIPEYKIEAMINNASTRYVSFDAPLLEDEDMTFIDIFDGQDIPATDARLMRESLALEIEHSLSTIPEREKDIVNLHFGLTDKPAMSLEEIGAQFYLTREQVDRILKMAIRRLKHPARSNRLKAYLEQ